MDWSRRLGTLLVILALVGCGPVHEIARRLQRSGGIGRETAVARHHRVDPVALRRQNMIRQLSARTPTRFGITYDSGRYEDAMNAALALADWDGSPARRAEAEATGQAPRYRRGRLRRDHKRGATRTRRRGIDS